MSRPTFMSVVPTMSQMAGSASSRMPKPLSTPSGLPLPLPLLSFLLLSLLPPRSALSELMLVGVVLGVAVVGLAGAISPDAKATTTTNITTTAATLLRRFIVAGEGAGDPEQPVLVADPAVRVILGVLMIAGAQVFTATQFVLEEFLLERSTIQPVEVVGWEGTFGLLVTLVGMLVLHLAVGRTDAGRYGPFDAVEGFRQMTGNRTVLVSSFLIMLSIG